MAAQAELPGLELGFDTRGAAGPHVSQFRQVPSLVLLNGLAGQNESWFCNRQVWSQHFDVSAPAIMVYDGAPIQNRMAADLPVSVEFLTDLLDSYLANYVQNPPYHLVASSLGCQIAVEYAARHPDQVDRLVLLCPSGVAPDEKLPVSDGVRHRDFYRLVASVFHDRRCVCPEIVEYYQRQFARKVWRKGAFRTIQDTRENSIRDKLQRLPCPALVICGYEDQIVDPFEVAELVQGVSNLTFRLLPECGHAPQIECGELVNGLVVQYLSAGRPA
jgi:pimeloyl-ACP methyl ester carboxylesterase